MAECPDDWITEEETKKYPKFYELLKRLSAKIEVTGASKDSVRDFQHEEARLRQEKERWLEQKLLLSEVHALLNDRQCKNSPESSEYQFYRSVDKFLAQCEVIDYIDCHPTPYSSTTLFGLSNEDIQRKRPNAKQVQAIQQRLIPDLEERLGRNCQQLVRFYNATEEKPATTVVQPDSVDAQDVPTLISQARDVFKTEEDEVKRHQRQLHAKYRQFYQILIDSLEVMSCLIEKHRLQGQNQVDTIKTDYLAAKCSEMQLKVKLLELQLKCETYYKLTVEALVKIRNHLDVASSVTSHKKSTTEHALKAYEAVGPVFDDLVQEYTQLKEDIDHKHWAVMHLNHQNRSS